MKTTICRTQNIILGNSKIRQAYLPEHYNTLGETDSYIVTNLLYAEDM